MGTAAKTIKITPPNFETLHVRVEGTSPYMQARFSEKARQKMRANQEAGQSARGKKTREARDFAADFIAAQHVSEDGWIGMPASAFRNAAIDVCRMVGFVMTHAKMSIFIEQDGRDKVDGLGLVRLDAGAPEQTEMAVPNANGNCDIRVRPLWREWAANLRVRYDADQFTAEDVVNLLSRAGMQIGVGEGRPFSKKSNGLGFGLWRIAEVKAAA